MSTAVNYSDLFNCNYLFRIQDALGNSGASATIVETNSGYKVDVTGSPSGTRSKASSAVQSQATDRATAASADTITLSPDAQRRLSDDKIAAQLLSVGADTAKPSTLATAATANGKVSSTTTAAAKGYGTDTASNAAGASQIAQEDPTQALNDAVNAAETAIDSISTTQGFAQAVANDPDLLKQVTSGFSSEDAAGLKAALAQGTLTVQRAAGMGVVLTGTSETGVVTADNQFSIKQVAGVKQTGISWGIGSILFSWPTSS